MNFSAMFLVSGTILKTRGITVVKDNYQRHRQHRFKPITTSRLRLEVSATNGSPEARVYEIRVY